MLGRNECAVGPLHGTGADGRQLNVRAAQAQLTSPLDGAGDGVDEGGVEVGGQVVAHAVDDQQLRTGYGAGGRAATRDVDHPVGRAVDDQRRHRQPAQPRTAVALVKDRQHLSHHAAGGHAAVEGLVGPGDDLVVGLGEGRRADQLPRPGRGRGVRVAPGAARGDQRRQQPRVLPADRALAGRRHDAGQRAHPFGPGDGHGLGDHAAHRDADDVRGLEPEVVQQPEAVVGHVGRACTAGARRGRRRPAPARSAGPAPRPCVERPVSRLS